MRWDLTGLFWDDYVPPKVKIERIKRTPPEPVWLADDYLPGLAEAQAYQFDLMSDADLLAAHRAKHRLVWDTEFYPNYSLLGVQDIETDKIIKFEINDGARLADADAPKLRWILKNFTVVGFNDNAFDVPMAMATLAGFSTEKLMQCVKELIHGGEYMNGITPAQLYRQYKISSFYVDNIDLIELTPLSPGLKVCAGRLHAPRMADLPFVPEKTLLPEQKAILRYYWVNDLTNTKLNYLKNKEAIELRELLTKEYGTDVRSKSDPQIAEAVIRAEVKRITGRKYIQKAEIRAGTIFRYRPPAYVKYQSPMMQEILRFIQLQNFEIDPYGSPTMPEGLAGLDITIGESVYRMGIGGLHSKEKKTIHLSDENFELTDNDVTSYYPSLIIQQGMYPPHVGPAFLQVFERIYHRRLAAKKAGDKGTAETLKIVLNGTFGKTGERGGHSVVYYPEMMIQVTVTGQLSLLMLIEALELTGIPVVSANTDGIMIKCPRHMLDLKQEIIDWWQRATGLGLESKGYKAVYSRDVNNYIALYEKPDEKEKDAFRFAKAIGTFRKTLDVYPLKWNPTCDICSEAVIAYLAEGVAIDHTIRKCSDVRKFIEVRRVNGGAAKDGEYLGKIIRWYYAKDEKGEILNAKNGYVVPRSAGGKPCMILPTSIPEDLDHDYYIQRAYGMLEDLSIKSA